MTNQNESTQAETVKLKTDTSVEPIGNNQTPIQPYDNVLHQYPSYTYNISLSALSPDDLKYLTNSPHLQYTPKNVMVASAGRFTQNRNIYFTNDFFFDKLEFETIIGMSAESQNSNSVNGSFTIIEPYGMTFFDNILKMANDLVGEKINYLQLPYLLMIDFFAYDNKGNYSKVVGQTKYIPIMISESKLKISEKGSEYNFQFYPFSHQAFNESYTTTPAKFEIAATNISEFFLAYQSDAGVTKQVQYADGGFTPEQRIRVKQQEDKITDPQRRKTLDDVQKIQNAHPAKYLSSSIVVSSEVKSYTGAVNSWNRAAMPPGKEDYADVIKFEIHEDIVKNAKFPSPALVDKENKAFGKIDPTKKDKTVPDQNGLYTNVSDNRVLMNINEGTSVLEVIKLAITNSSFIRDNMIDLTKDSFTQAEIDKWLKHTFSWFKVIPKITLGKFDKVNNRFQKTITYRITPFETVNYKTRSAPQGKIPNNYVCKDYEYIFTGKNYDIISFDLSFDTQFYVLEQVSVDKKDAISNAQKKSSPESTAGDAKEKMYDRAYVQSIIDNRENGIIEFKPRTVYTGGTTGQSLATDSKAEIVKQAAKNVLTTPGGDMLSVKLKIVGDPDFIKQDDFFYSSEDLAPTPAGAPKKLLGGVGSVGGSLVTDANEIFVNLTFKTPTDYSITGLANPRPTDGSKHSTSIMFSGRYKVLKVMNTFSGGKFEQELDLIRYPDQPTEDNAATDTVVRPMKQNSISTTTLTKVTGSAIKAKTDAVLKEAKAISSKGSSISTLTSPPPALPVKPPPSSTPVLSVSQAQANLNIAQRHLADINSKIAVLQASPLVSTAAGRATILPQARNLLDQRDAATEEVNSARGDLSYAQSSQNNKTS